MFCCIGGATVFWLLNNLNKVHTAEINYPISFVIDESKMVFATTPPPTIRLEVTGGGWRLLQYLLRFNVQSIQLPVAHVAKHGHIRSEYLYPIFAQRLKDLKVHRVLMDTPLDVHAPSPKLSKD